MCYGSSCLFEGHLGECTIHTLDFKKKYGYTPCMVGHSIQNKEDIEFYEKNKEDLDKVYRQYNEDKENELKKFREDFSK